MSVPAVKNHGISFTPAHEDYCPHRALAASVIIRAVLDYCEAKSIESDPQGAMVAAVRERALRVACQHRTRARRVEAGASPMKHKDIESAEAIADKKIAIAQRTKDEASKFLRGKVPETRHWFEDCGMPHFTQKKLHWCYVLYKKDGISQTTIEEFCRAEKTGNNAAQPSEVQPSSPIFAQPRTSCSPEARKEHVPEVRR